MSAEALVFGLSLARAQAALQRQLEERLAEWHGLDMGGYLLLQALEPEGQGLTLPTLAQALQCKPAAVLRQLLPMEKTGLLERAGGRVQLRAVGRSLLGEARQTAGAICDRALQALRLEPAALAACLQVLESLAAPSRRPQ
jgi:DNA-binding IclR family transcriptional regulator